MAVIPMTAVTSSQIQSIGHLGTKLAVQFNNGSVYEYQNVSAALHDQLMKAPSVGSFFSQNIKNKPAEYPCTKVV